MQRTIVNERAHFDYDISEKLSVGIMLTGHEAKSIKTGHASLRGARVLVRGNELFVVGLEIPSFQPTNAPDKYNPSRTLKLLAKREEIAYIAGKLSSGLTVIPLRVYTHRDFVKIEIAIARLRKKHDKRELIKKRETLREIKKGDAGL